jgi:hypothetical protein
MHDYFDAESNGRGVNVVGYEAATTGLGLTQTWTGRHVSQGKITVGDDFLNNTTADTLSNVSPIGRSHSAGRERQGARYHETRVAMIVRAITV